MNKEIIYIVCVITLFLIPLIIASFLGIYILNVAFFYGSICIISSVLGIISLTFNMIGAYGNNKERDYRKFKNKK